MNSVPCIYKVNDFLLVCRDNGSSQEFLILKGNSNLMKWGNNMMITDNDDFLHTITQ